MGGVIWEGVKGKKGVEGVGPPKHHYLFFFKNPVKYRDRVNVIGQVPTKELRSDYFTRSITIVYAGEITVPSCLFHPYRRGSHYRFLEGFASCPRSPPVPHLVSQFDKTVWFIVQQLARSTTPSYTVTR